jgi:hypothetical protein
MRSITKTQMFHTKCNVLNVFHETCYLAGACMPNLTCIDVTEINDEVKFFDAIK